MILPFSCPGNAYQDWLNKVIKGISFRQGSSVMISKFFMTYLSQ